MRGRIENLKRRKNSRRSALGLAHYFIFSLLALVNDKESQTKARVVLQRGKTLTDQCEKGPVARGLASPYFSPMRDSAVRVSWQSISHPSSIDNNKTLRLFLKLTLVTKKKKE